MFASWTVLLTFWMDRKVFCWINFSFRSNNSCILSFITSKSVCLWYVFTKRTWGEYLLFPNVVMTYVKKLFWSYQFLIFDFWKKIYRYYWTFLKCNCTPSISTNVGVNNFCWNLSSCQSFYKSLGISNNIINTRLTFSWKILITKNFFVWAT